MGTSLLGIGYLESRNSRVNPVPPASYYAAPIVCKSRIRAGPEPRGTCRSGERIMGEGRVGWFSPPRRPAPTIASCASAQCATTRIQNGRGGTRPSRRRPCGPGCWRARYHTGRRGFLTLFACLARAWLFGSAIGPAAAGRDRDNPRHFCALCGEGCPDQPAASIFRLSWSRMIFGLALPPEACMTWPIRKPIALPWPLRTSATAAGFAAKA